MPQVYDFILFMANTGLRPDEAFNLQHRDVTIASNDGTASQILEIEVRGKRGVGHCKSMPGAVRVYQRLLARAKCEIRLASACVFRTNGVRRFFRSAAETVSKPWSTLPA
jgi:hypothetical protein